MFEEKDMDDIQDPVVEVQQQEDNYDDVELPEASETEEVAEPQKGKEAQSQTPEENAQYKKMRLRAEEEARRVLEKERKQVEEMKIQVQQNLAEKKILDEYLNPKKIVEYADERGISDEVAREILQSQAQQIIMQEKTKVAENYSKLQSKKNELKSKYAQFTSVEGEVDAVLAQYPNATDVDYENLFYHTVGRKALELNTESAKAMEKRTIANMHDKARRKTVSGSDGGVDVDVVPSSILTNEGMAMAKAFGHDPRVIAKYVKNNKK